MKKKILALALCGMLSAGMVCGCSSDDGKGDETNTTKNSEVNNDSSDSDDDENYDDEDNDEIGEDTDDENADDENVTNDNSVVDDGIHNTTKYINDSSTKSTDKLAFISGNKVVTLDYKDIVKDDFIWDRYQFTNNMIWIYDYNSEIVNISGKLDDLGLSIEENSDRVEESEIIEKDGKWLLYKGNLDDSYVADYILEDEDYRYWTLSLNIYNSETVDVAKEEFNRLKDIVNVYMVEEENYINVKDVDGNEVSLDQYYFIEDIIADLLKTNCKMHVTDPKCFASFYTSDLFFLNIPDDSDENVNYEIEFRSSDPYDDETPDEIFDFNGCKAYKYKEHDRICIYMPGNKYILVEYNDTDDVSKELFYKHFK